MNARAVEVGDMVVGGAALMTLPVGTHIEHNGVRYIRHDDGWSHGSIHRYGADLALSGPSRVLYLPVVAEDPQ